ncbi:MAG: L,D-transpeptidase family protein [Actinomycetales bacterium]|nr:L,D-transpeptidase family protein [Actinomycetales bacterium]
MPVRTRARAVTSVVSTTVIAVACGSLLAVGMPSVAYAASVPQAPTITNVVSGHASRQLLVEYALPGDNGGAPISTVEVSLDSGTTWYPCAGLEGSCPLGNLSNGRSYGIVLRAVNEAGPGPASGQAVATPSRPSADTDPDKPAELPKPRSSVTATFLAAGNGLGVTGEKALLGVGTLPRIRFSRAIGNKGAVERHLKVTATDARGNSIPITGAWGWLDDRTVMFRPKDYWPGNATVTITSTIDGAVLGKSGSTTLVGGTSLAKKWTFRTTRRLIARVDGATHRMTVHIDGKKVKVFPVSLGSNGWNTTNGVKVISTSKLASHTYTSEALGLTNPADYYVLPNVPWNTRVTPSGEFIHSAPWAYGRIGRWNGSHGCTNMFADDAKWIYDKTVPGDVVIYQNTGGRTVATSNGPGGLWNVPWDKWLERSALGSITGVPEIDQDQQTDAPASA